MASTCLTASPWTLPTPVKYATDNLRTIASTLGLDSQDLVTETADTVIFFNVKSCDARADVRNGVVSHIGYRIFPDTARSINALPVFDFLERHSLENDLSVEDANPLETEKIRYNNLKEPDLTTLFRRNLPFNVRTVDYLNYEVEWQKGDGGTMRVTVPVSYELLHGSSLPENERRLFEELSDSSGIDVRLLPASHTVDKEQLTPTFKPNCFIMRGAHLFSEDLTSDRYYQSDTSSVSSSFKILDSESYPVESIANMLSGVDIPNDIEVELSMIAYPMEKRTIKIPLSRMTAYFLSKGCEIFTGVTSVDDSGSQYVMICRNAPQGYCHSLKINVPAEAYPKKSGLAKAKITPYIPLSKIINLYYGE